MTQRSGFLLPQRPKQKPGEFLRGCKSFQIAFQVSAPRYPKDKRVALAGSVRVEVRSLEDVLSEMERDYTGLYGGTMLIPPGLARGDIIEAPFANIGERKIINLQNRTQ